MSMSAPAAPAAAPPADPVAPSACVTSRAAACSTIEQVEKIAAQMIRVTLTGDLEGFKSLGFDDHIKLFFPDGTTNAEGAPNMLGRDFTPRRYDPINNMLVIHFAIHDAGPATRWAEQAQPGQMLSIGGPRGSFIIPTTYDWHLLIADETGLPAIGAAARRTARRNAGRRRGRGRTVRPTRSPSRPKPTRPSPGRTATAPQPAPATYWRRRC